MYRIKEARKEKCCIVQGSVDEDKKLELMQKQGSSEKGSSSVPKFISICFPLSNGCFE